MSIFSRKPAIDPGSEHRDWQLVANIAQNVLTEQKRSRRWGIFFKLLTFLYLAVALTVFLSADRRSGMLSANKPPHTAMVTINGIIAHDSDANANMVVTGLRRAFENDNAVAVLLVINSPGGSPVQAGYVYDEIKRLRGEYTDKKLYAVIEDLGASGGYYIAAAADEIYADKASLVGSIGVTAAGFGFVDLMEKVGIERRNFASGKHKSFLDPFAPLKQTEKVFWESVLQKTHEQFIRIVKEGRGDRLLANEELFTGLIWNGEQALDLGLIDGLGSPGYVAREIVGEEEIFNYTPRPSPIEEFTRQFGVAVGLGISRALGLNTEAPVQLR